MTNREYLENLTQEAQQDCLATYSKNKHPLYDYIDWDAYWGSTDGNELHFLRTIREYTDNEGRRYAVLKEMSVDGMDYELSYRFDDDSIIQSPIWHDSDNSISIREYNELLTSRSGA